jgi:hypothetical protein
MASQQLSEDDELSLSNAAKRRKCAANGAKLRLISDSGDTSVDDDDEEAVFLTVRARCSMRAARGATSATAPDDDGNVSATRVTT